MSGKRERARRFGLRAETLCALRLRLGGWRVLDRGWSLGRGRGVGEVDIIARRGTVLAFVEVKARDGIETALEALGPVQRKRLSRAAEAYLAARPELAHLQKRFDVMLVTADRFWPVHLRDAWRARP